MINELQQITWDLWNVSSYQRDILETELGYRLQFAYDREEKCYTVKEYTQTGYDKSAYNTAKTLKTFYKSQDLADYLNSVKASIVKKTKEQKSSDWLKFYPVRYYGRR
jgi:hypothetical protein